MINTEVESLTNQLREIRLERANVVELLEKITKDEVSDVKELEEAKTKIPSRGTCPFDTGNILRMTNHLRDKYSTVGEARKVCNTLVTIRNSGTGNDYYRAWWNLELVETVSGEHSSKIRVRR